MPNKIIEKIMDANTKINKSNEEIRIKKQSFSEEWNKWGKRGTNNRKMP